MLDIARGRPASQSSVSNWSHYASCEQEAAIANSGAIDFTRFCHTDLELQPWWRVEFDGVYDLDRIVIYNRVDQPARLARFSLQRSFDGDDWVECYRKTDGAISPVYAIRFERPCPARFLRLRLDGYNYLHFSGLQAFGSPADSRTVEAARLADAETLAQAKATPPGKSGHWARIGEFEAFIDEAYSDVMRFSLQSGGYEGRERMLVGRFVRPSDRVLELGTAVGVVSMTAAAIVGANHVKTFDANPAMIEAARENFERNGFSAIDAKAGIVVNRRQYQAGATMRFYVSKDFWASRLDADPHAPDIVRTINVPMFCLEDEIARAQANVLICDIEGGEVDLFEGADLTGIGLIVIETHYAIAGVAPTDAMMRALILQGFNIDLAALTENVVVLRR